MSAANQYGNTPWGAMQFAMDSGVDPLFASRAIAQLFGGARRQSLPWQRVGRPGSNAYIHPEYEQGRDVVRPLGMGGPAERDAWQQFQINRTMPKEGNIPVFRYEGHNQPRIPLNENTIGGNGWFRPGINPDMSPDYLSKYKQPPSSYPQEALTPWYDAVPAMPVDQDYLRVAREAREAPGTGYGYKSAAYPRHPGWNPGGNPSPGNFRGLGRYLP